MVHPTISVTWEKDNNPSWDPEVEKIVKEQLVELQKEIDENIMIDMLVLQGWTKVELERLKGRHESIDIEEWMDQNCTGKHTKLGRTFVFEKKQDAEWFMLKWL